tara:strand:+ start:7324 stop:7536 length:213 start_codon:yes stop_codon:yes gene_type:complete
VKDNNNTRAIKELIACVDAMDDVISDLVLYRPHLEEGNGDAAAVCVTLLQIFVRQHRKAWAIDPKNLMTM